MSSNEPLLVLADSALELLAASGIAQRVHHQRRGFRVGATLRDCEPISSWCLVHELPSMHLYCLQCMTINVGKMNDDLRLSVL